ncbi:MAG TPA: Ig domain-containing protein [Phycisphaerae bacterium]|nr:Ig domain-containing protein [Phycisphaerae bacterium]
MPNTRQGGWLFVIGLLTLAAAGCAPSDPVAIVPETLPNGVVGLSYALDLDITTLDPPTWRIIAGSLPPGLFLDDNTGKIAGVPGREGSYRFTIAALGRMFPVPLNQTSLVLTIVPRLTAAGDPPAGIVSRAYFHQFAAGGGVPPYSFSLVGLPAGLTFDGQTGIITGIPVIPLIDVRLDLTVADSGRPQQQITESFSLIIKPVPVRVGTTQLPVGKVRVAYSAQLAAEQGLPPYRWAMVNGLLPDGLRLDQVTGAITGTPTEHGTGTIEVRVTDSDSPPTSDTKSFTLTIEP